MTDIFKSPLATIGWFEWRVVVFEREDGKRLLKYQFRGLGQLPLWDDHEKWPTYDSDNGATAGLPRELKQLYNRNIREIDIVLGKVPMMAELF